MDIEKEVCNMFSESSGKIAGVDSTIEELGIDSLEFIQVLLEIDEKYGVKVPSDAAADMVTVGNVIAFIKKGVAHA